MSEKEPKHTNICSASEHISNAVELIIQAQRFNSKMQVKYTIGDQLWHEHEAIDDRLHDALAALGE
jgi:hypothetical protein